MILRSRLRVGSCLDRLSRHATESAVPGSYDEISVHLDGMNLRLEKQISYQNSFATDFVGEIIPVEGGTLVRGHFRESLSTRIFSWVLFAISTGLVTFCIWLGMRETGDLGEAIRTCILQFPSPGFVVFGGLVIVALCRWLAWKEEVHMLAFLREILSADGGPGVNN